MGLTGKGIEEKELGKERKEEGRGDQDVFIIDGEGP